MGLVGEQKDWSFEGKLNRLSRDQQDISSLALAKNIEIFDPITDKIYKGSSNSFVLGSWETNMSDTHMQPDYFHAHNIIVPHLFEVTVPRHKVAGYPLIIQGKDFFQTGIFITGIRISQNQSDSTSLCIIVLFRLNNLEYVKLLDDYKKKLTK